MNETSNVIEVKFSNIDLTSSSDEYRYHLDSLVDLTDDPIEDLLNEFESQWEDDLDKKSEDFNQIEDYKVSYKQDLLDMGANLIEQVKAIREKTLRLKYYLDELNIDS